MKEGRLRPKAFRGARSGKGLYQFKAVVTY
jgi:hypothetical protein